MNKETETIREHCVCCPNFDILQHHLDTERLKHAELHSSIRLDLVAYAGLETEEEVEPEIKKICHICKEEGSN